MPASDMGRYVFSNDLNQSLFYFKELTMSFLDNVLGAVKDLEGDAHQGPLMGHVLELLSGGNPGGLTGLVQKFRDNGMDDLVSSWIATGANLSVAPEKIQQVLGAPLVQQLAAKSGIAPADVLTQLAQILPQVINHLTPNGSLPAAGMVEQGIGLLKGKFLS
jgi:uncharacterized protein YidB (DUF937 family)